MSKIWIVALREYLVVVRRWGFILTTMLIPLSIILPGIVVSYISMLQFAKDEEKKVWVGIVDQPHLLDADDLQLMKQVEPSALPPELANLPKKLTDDANVKKLLSGTPIEFRLYDTVEQAKEDLKTNVIQCFYLLPEDYIETGRIQLHTRDNNLLGNDRRNDSVKLRKAIITSLLKQKVNKEIITRVTHPVSIEELSLDGNNQFVKSNAVQRLSTYLVPLAFSVLLLIAIFMSSGYLLQGVSTEKGNRVMEILLSSLTPFELMTGKLIGLGVAGMTQVMIWLMFAMLPALALFPFLTLNVAQIVLSMVYFLFGYVLFGSMMLSLGSLGETQQESQQIAGFISFIAAVPLMFLGVIIHNPDGMAARVLSFFPLTAPNVMILRLGAGPIPWLDVALSLMLLTAGVYLALKLSAKLFRVGVLLYGKRPTVGEIWRWVRA